MAAPRRSSAASTSASSSAYAPRSPDLSGVSTYYPPDPSSLYPHAHPPPQLPPQLSHLPPQAYPAQPHHGAFHQHQHQYQQHQPQHHHQQHYPYQPQQHHQQHSTAPHYFSNPDQSSAQQAFQMPASTRSQRRPDQESSQWLLEPHRQQPVVAAGAYRPPQAVATIPDDVKLAPGQAEGIVVRTKFPVARIKRIVQADEDVGKVAQVTPVVVAKALEIFMISLTLKSAEQARSRSVKKITGAHLKQAVQKDEQFDFLSEIVSKIADAPASKKEAEEDSDDDPEGGLKKKKVAPRRKRKEREES